MASKGKRIGRLFEKWVVHWLAKAFNLIPLVKDKSGTTNITKAQIARAEEVNQHLDNLGIDIWIEKSLFLSRFGFQCKSTLSTAKSGKNIDVEPLFAMPEDRIRVLITEIKYRAKGKKNMMKWGRVATVELDTLEMLIKAYLKQEDNG